MFRFGFVAVLVLTTASFTFGQTVVEDFEQFNLGTLDGQIGWTSESPVEIVNSGVAGFGQRSIRAFNVGPNNGDYVTSPVFNDNGFGTISFDIKIDDPEPLAEYIVSTLYKGGATQFLHFHPADIMTLNRSVGSCAQNDALVGGKWSKGKVMRLDWRVVPTKGSVVSQHQIRLNNEIIFEGPNHLGCGFEDKMDSFTIWSTGSFPADVTIDNVRFDPFVDGEVDEVIPASVAVTFGELNLGGTASLAVSDNVDLSIYRAAQDALSRTEFEVEALSPTETPAMFNVSLEGAVFSRTTVNQSIDLWNFDSAQWEEHRTSPATRFQDSIVTVIPAGDLSRFVEKGVGSVRARVRFQSPVNRQRFSSNTDSFIWSIR